MEVQVRINRHVRCGTEEHSRTKQSNWQTFYFYMLITVQTQFISLFVENVFF